MQAVVEIFTALGLAIPGVLMMSNRTKRSKGPARIYVLDEAARRRAIQKGKCRPSVLSFPSPAA